MVICKFILILSLFYAIFYHYLKLYFTTILSHILHQFQVIFYLHIKTYFTTILSHAVRYHLKTICHGCHGDASVWEWVCSWKRSCVCVHGRRAHVTVMVLWPESRYLSRGKFWYHKKTGYIHVRAKINSYTLRNTCVLAVFTTIHSVTYTNTYIHTYTRKMFTQAHHAHICIHHAHICICICTQKDIYKNSQKTHTHTTLKH